MCEIRGGLEPHGDEISQAARARTNSFVSVKDVPKGTTLMTGRTGVDLDSFAVRLLRRFFLLFVGKKIKRKSNQSLASTGSYVEFSNNDVFHSITYGHCAVFF